MMAFYFVVWEESLFTSAYMVVLYITTNVEVILMSYGGQYILEDRLCLFVFLVGPLYRV